MGAQSDPLEVLGEAWAGHTKPSPQCMAGCHQEGRRVAVVKSRTLLPGWGWEEALAAEPEACRSQGATGQTRPTEGKKHRGSGVADRSVRWGQQCGGHGWP